MGKRFRSDNLNQALLLPPSLHDWLPEEHLARFLVDVMEALDLAAAAEVTQETNDKQQLIPMIAQIVTNLEQKPEKVKRRHGLLQRGECDR